MLEKIIEKLIMLGGKSCIPIVENNGLEWRVTIFYFFCLHKKRSQWKKIEEIQKIKKISVLCKKCTTTTIFLGHLYYLCYYIFNEQDLQYNWINHFISYICFKTASSFSF